MTPAPTEASVASGGPWQRLLTLALTARRRWYAQRSRRLPVPVLSVGNIHLGGTGKTPLVAAIARRLRDRGWRLAVLSRGYGRSTRGMLVASRGDGLLAAAREVGDEPAALAAELRGVSVIVGEDRYAAGRRSLALLEPPPEAFLLDDGFSHLGLARDLDLLTFPASSPWGNGKLAPFGPLREPLGSVRHADAVILTGLDRISNEGDRLAQALRPYGYGGPGFGAALAAGCRPQPPPGTSVLLVTGVARPGRVLASARRLHLDVVEHLRFPDHHPFPERSLRRIRRAQRRCGATAVAVTSKDRHKLADRLEGSLLELTVRAEPEAAFWSWLEERVRRCPRSGTP